MIDEMLKKYNLKYEDLNAAELETFTSMVSSAQQNVLTIERLRDQIQSMRLSVENELATSPTNLFTWLLGWRKDYLLKARLRNYILLEQVLTSPEKARKAIDEALSHIKK